LRSALDEVPVLDPGKPAIQQSHFLCEWELLTSVLSRIKNLKHTSIFTCNILPCKCYGMEAVL
jgi:hypothetical protein